MIPTLKTRQEIFRLMRIRAIRTGAKIIQDDDSIVRCYWPNYSRFKHLLAPEQRKQITRVTDKQYDTIIDYGRY